MLDERDGKMVWVENGISRVRNCQTLVSVRPNGRVKIQKLRGLWVFVTGNKVRSLYHFIPKYHSVGGVDWWRYAFWFMLGAWTMRSLTMLVGR